MHRKRNFFEIFKKISRSAYIWADFGGFRDYPARSRRADGRVCAAREYPSAYVARTKSADFRSFCSSPRHPPRIPVMQQLLHTARSKAVPLLPVPPLLRTVVRRRTLPTRHICPLSADSGVYHAAIRERIPHIGAFFVVLRCSAVVLPLSASLLHTVDPCASRLPRLTPAALHPHSVSRTSRVTRLRRFAPSLRRFAPPLHRKKRLGDFLRAAFHIPFTASGGFQTPEGKKRAPPCRVKQG